MTKIFVFGSNLQGRHGKGAALDACNNWGAIEGVGEGLAGNSYAIPTKRYSESQKDRWGNKQLIVRPLTNVKKSIARFIDFAKEHPEWDFLVTEVGCGLAGFKPTDIAPAFVMAAFYSHVYFPERFLSILQLKRDRLSFDTGNVLASKHYETQ